MSIRSLTARLKDEAREVRKREAVATLSPSGANADDTTPPELGRRAASGGGNAGSHRSRAMLRVSVPSDAIHADPVAATHPLRKAGIRPRELRGRWEPPGGIAARFSLQADNDLGRPRDPIDAEVSRGQVPAIGPDASAEGRRVESPPSGGDTTPITIELESHQESAD